MTITHTADAVEAALADRYHAPSEGQFSNGDNEPPIDFLPADDVRGLAEVMIAEYPELEHLRTAFTVTYLWKRDGGKVAGKATLGKCTKPSGLLKYFAETTFVIWLAANHVNDLMLSKQQVRALIYHELSHAQVEVSEEGEAKPVVAPHDFQGFTAEIRRFGAWQSDLAACRTAWEQVPIPLFDGVARKASDPIIPPGSGIDSVTISDNHGRSVTLDANTRARANAMLREERR